MSKTCRKEAFLKTLVYDIDFKKLHFCTYVQAAHGDEGGGEEYHFETGP